MSDQAQSSEMASDKTAASRQTTSDRTTSSEGASHPTPSNETTSTMSTSDQTASGLATPRILALPVEIADHIASYLPTPDVSSLRLTCKAMDHLFRESFFRNCFREKQFDIHDASLRALVGMSGHPKVSQSLEHVALGLEHSRLAFMEVNDTVPARYNSIQQLRLFCARQQRLLGTDHSVAVLTESFAKLPKLKTISIRDFSTSQYSESPTATYMGPWDDVQVMHSYGADASLQAIGNLLAKMKNVTSNGLPHRLGLYDDIVGEAFTDVLESLANANARPDAIEVIIGHPSWALSDEAFSQPARLRIKNLRAILHNLKKLHLDLHLHRDVTPISYYEDIDIQQDIRRGADTVNLSPYLLLFLSATPNLEWLRLGLRRSRQHHSEQLLRWLASDQDPAYGFYSHEFPPPIKFVHLEHLQIVGAMVPHDALVGFIHRLSDKLKKLGLKDISITTEHQAAEGEEHVWSRFLKFLAIQCANLESFSLENAGISAQEGSFFRICGGAEYCTAAWKFHSPADMKQCLEELAEEIELPWIWDSEIEDSEQEDADGDSEDEATDDE